MRSRVPLLLARAHRQPRIARQTLTSSARQLTPEVALAPMVMLCFLRASVGWRIHVRPCFPSHRHNSRGQARKHLPSDSPAATARARVYSHQARALATRRNRSRNHSHSRASPSRPSSQTSRAISRSARSWRRAPLGPRSGASHPLLSIALSVKSSSQLLSGA